MKNAHRCKSPSGSQQRELGGRQDPETAVGLCVFHNCRELLEIRLVGRQSAGQCTAAVMTSVLFPPGWIKLIQSPGVPELHVASTLSNAFSFLKILVASSRRAETVRFKLSEIGLESQRALALPRAAHPVLSRVPWD